MTGPGNTAKLSGFSIASARSDPNHANGDSVPVQIHEACDYLRRIGPLIEGIRRDVDGCHCVIDFSWDFPQSTLGQYNTFPNELIALLHEFEIALMVSVYSQSTSSVNDSMSASGELGVISVNDQLLPSVDR